MIGAEHLDPLVNNATVTPDDGYDLAHDTPILLEQRFEASTERPVASVQTVVLNWLV